MTATGSVAARAAVGRYRWTICALIFFATTINYMDRQMLGLLAPLLQKDIGWNQIQYAQTVMVFTVAYAVGLAVFGRLADRFSTRVVYGSAMAMWSLAAMLHAVAATVPGFAAVRGLLGFGEAANFPVAIRTTATWFPKKERALATGLWNMGATVGGIVAPAFAPIAAVMWGWRITFIVAGAARVLWLAGWLVLYPRRAQDRDGRLRGVRAADRDAVDLPEPVVRRVRGRPRRRRAPGMVGESRHYRRRRVSTPAGRHGDRHRWRGGHDRLVLLFGRDRRDAAAHGPVLGALRRRRIGVPDCARHHPPADAAHDAREAARLT